MKPRLHSDACRSQSGSGVPPLSGSRAAVPAVASREGRAFNAPWPTVPLGDVVESMKNGIYKKREAYADDGTACLRMYNIDDGRIVWRDIKRMRLDVAELQDYRLLPGDLLVNRVNSRELVGKTAVIPDGIEPAVFESKNIRVRLNRTKANPQFVSLQLLLAGSSYFAQNAQQVVGMASISQPQIARFPIVLPPVKEQRRIVAEIEKQFTRLDAGVAALKRVQAGLKRYRAAVLKAACEGKLVPTEAALAKVAAASRRGKSGSSVPPLGPKKSRDGSSTFETGAQLLTRILAERRQNWQGRGRYNEPANPERVKLAQPPEGWTWASIEQLRVFSLYGPRFSSDDYTDDGYIVLRTTDISESGKVDATNAPRLRLSKDEFDRYRAKRGDLLVTRTGSLGTLAVFDDEVEAIPGAYLIQFRLATEPVTTRYLFFFLKSPIGQSYLTGKGAGVGRPNLNAPTIEALPVPLPPLAEQTRIVAEVERRLSVIEELEAVVSANLLRAGRLRQSILRKAFRGDLS